MIIVAMVVSIGLCIYRLADFVGRGDLAHTLHRKGQTRGPGLTGSLVGEIVFRTALISQAYLFAHPVLIAQHQVRLYSAHQIDVAHRGICMSWERTAPHD